MDQMDSGGGGKWLLPVLLLLWAVAAANGDSSSVDDHLLYHRQHHRRHHHHHQHHNHHQQHQQPNHHQHSQELRPSLAQPLLSRQQVPEQSPPIVVSSSDNSYVSASPFELGSISSQSPPPQPTRSHTSRKRFAQQLRRNKLLLSSSSSNAIREGGGSSSDISTTATTTQRSNRNHRLARQRLSKPLYELDETDLELDDDDEEDGENGADGVDEEEYDGLDNGEEVDTDDEQEPFREQVLPNLTKKHHQRASSVGAKFNTKAATIIKTRESILMGATFINYTLVTNLNACLVECYVTDSCDTAIYQETPVDFNNHLPQPQPPQPQSSAKLGHYSNSLHSYLSSSLSYISSSSAPPTSLLLDRLSNDGDGQDDDEEEEAAAAAANVDGVGNEDEDEEEDEDDADDDDDDDEDENIRGNLERKRPKLGFFVCYLFQCAKFDGFKCQFSAHNHYISALKARKPRRTLRPPPKIAPATTTTTTTTTTTSSPPPPPPAAPPELLDEEGVQFNQIRPVYGEVPEYARRIISHQEVQSPAPGWFKRAPGERLRPTAWRDVHHASISIEQEDYNHYTGAGGLPGALVAILVGIAATGTIIVVVGHKMKSIRRRIAYKAGRSKRPGPLLPPDADYLITTMPMPSAACNGDEDEDMEDNGALDDEELQLKPPQAPKVSHHYHYHT